MRTVKLTAEQKRELVLEYFLVPLGQRTDWLLERGVHPRTFHRWRRMLMAGALETGLIPRGGVWVSVDENAELGRLHAENKKLRAELDKAREDLESRDRVVDALGKAIELLQDGTAGEGEDEAKGRP